MVATVKDNHLVLRCSTTELSTATLRLALDKYLAYFANFSLIRGGRECALQSNNLI